MSYSWGEARDAMYHAHFGLERPLFDGGIARDQSVFRSGQHERLVERFKLALASPSAAITLTGPPGIGKTTLTATALRASSTRVSIAWLHGLVTNGTELVELLLAELGLSAERATRVERLQLWRQFHSEMAATESRVFIVAERADDLSVEVLRALDGLTAPDATGYTGVNVVLLGQAGLEAHLEAPPLESLRQRIRLRARLEPFTEAELQDYLRHQTACAGGEFDRVFAPGAVAALYRHSGGVARLANHLCETALAIAADEREKLLRATVVQRVATTILGLREPPSVGGEAPVVAAAAAAPLPLAGSPSVAASAAPEPAPRPAATSIPSLTLPPPVAAAPPVPTPAVAPIAVASAPPPANAANRSTPLPPAGATPAAPPASAAAATARPPVPEFEFDGEATEVPDVSVIDFPVLTDAVDDEPPPARFAAPPAAAKPTPSPEPAPHRRIETAYASSRHAAAAKPAASPAPAPKPPAPSAAEPKRAAPSPTPPAHDAEADDALRQTQTLRAIADARSIDDISSSMAETLFGEAELDVLNAALAASIDEASAAPSAPVSAPARPAASAPPPRKPPVSTGDDLLDLLDLTSDATLELMDDPLDKPEPSRQSVGQR